MLVLVVVAVVGIPVISLEAEAGRCFDQTYASPYNHATPHSQDGWGIGGVTGYVRGDGIYNIAAGYFAVYEDVWAGIGAGSYSVADTAQLWREITVPKTGTYTSSSAYSYFGTSGGFIIILPFSAAYASTKITVSYDVFKLPDFASVYSHQETLYQSPGAPLWQDVYYHDFNDSGEHYITTSLYLVKGVTYQMRFSIHMESTAWAAGFGSSDANAAIITRLDGFRLVRC